jgi:YrbI family 3-deoxy-D-manno-octulosonate 8-phosphate phosphatase
MFWKRIPAGRSRRIKLLVCDVDGVLTDGGIFLDNAGMEAKRFSVLDGAGCALARHGGLAIAWITARSSELVALRAKECRVAWLKQGRQNKWPALEEICRESGIPPEATAFVGDDLVDLPVLQRVGLAIAVANAVPEVKRAAHAVTRRSGGHGAVREAIETLLKHQGRWRSAVVGFLGSHEAATQK